jgi:N-acetylmuramoyl-L-alanine amidase
MNHGKRVIGILGLVLMTGTMVMIQPEEKEIPEVIETIKPTEIHYLTDEELSLLYTCKPDERKTDPSIIEVSIEEANMLMRIAKVEHGYGSPEAQANVMKTVINRVNSDSFPDSIEGVILQEGQFSTVSSGKYAKASPDIDSHIALAMLEQGKINHMALYFEATDVKDSWMSKNKTFLFEQEGHRFYK